jgi:glycosyltransferase involved in cell wall biosynthesis
MIINLPLISIITVCHNEAERIADTITSIANQTYNNIQTIVIDGASTDGSLEILEANTPHIDHLISEPDEGVYHAMNKGIRMAQGEYLIFLNGGDKFYDQNVLSALFKDANTIEDIIYGNVSFVYPDGKKTISQPGRKIGKLFLTFNTLCHQSMFFRRSLFERAGLFDLDYDILSDYEFLARSILKHSATTLYVPVVISYFYKDGMSFSERNRDKVSLERLRLQKTHLPYIYQLVGRSHTWALGLREYLPKGRLRRAINSIFNRLFKPKEF